MAKWELMTYRYSLSVSSRVVVAGTDVSHFCFARTMRIHGPSKRFHQQLNSFATVRARSLVSATLRAEVLSHSEVAPTQAASRIEAGQHNDAADGGKEGAYVSVRAKKSPSQSGPKFFQSLCDEGRGAGHERSRLAWR